MPINVPDNQKIFTTTYENFKGVDFTNDPSNVWYRRSPDGLNLLPDESGKPYKRHGWKKEVTAEQFANLYAADNNAVAPSEISIRKCYYFQLAGLDHLVVFTNYGVFIYREEEGTDARGVLMSSKTMNPQSMISYDKDMIESWDRAYFFEGNGKAAFYIYGGYKIWEYSYNTDTEKYEWNPVEPYIPTVNIAVDAKHLSGEAYETVNMLSDYIAESFQNNVFATVTGRSTTVPQATVRVTEIQFLSLLWEEGTYVFTYTNEDHSWLYGGDKVQISDYGITIDKTPQDGNTITVTVSTVTRINLPKMITSTEGMQVWAAEDYAFNKRLTLHSVEPASPQMYDCTLITVGSNSYLKFYKEFLPLVDGEDAIKVIYPRNAVETTTHHVPENLADYIEITLTVAESNVVPPEESE